MILETLKALLLAGIPIAIASYYLVKITHQIKDDDKKGDKTTKTKQTIKVRQMVYHKYLKFGGGFYGLVALITYIHIEIYQILDFIEKFTSLSDFIDRIGLSMIIKFFIEAIMNFVSAITWPIYWLKYLPIGTIWIWLTVAIITHSVATKYALIKYKKDNHN